MKKIITILIFLFLVYGFAVWSKLYVQTDSPYVGLGRFEKNYIPVPSIKPISDKISYKGQDGKDALNLLRASNSIEQDSSGLVVSINNRKADNSKHEYWAFYINGKLSNTGPAEYVTKNSDSIVWKIDKY